MRLLLLLIIAGSSACCSRRADDEGAPTTRPAESAIDNGVLRDPMDGRFGVEAAVRGESTLR